MLLGAEVPEVEIEDAIGDEGKVLV